MNCISVVFRLIARSSSEMQFRGKGFARSFPLTFFGSAYILCLQGDEDMRKKLFWWIAGATIILGLMWLLLSTYFDQVLPGIKNSSEFIECFNAGNSPDGIELDDTITDNSFCISNGFVCRIVPVIGDEDICFRVYSRERDGIVYAIRIDETVSVYSEPTRLIAINEYLYSAFFKYASKDER